MTPLKTWLRRALVRPMIHFRTGPPHPGIDHAALNRQRIAFVKLDGIGDFVLATTLLQLCRKNLPDADITLFCRKPVGNLARHQFPGWTVVELASYCGPLKQIFLRGEARRLLKSQRPFDLLVDLRTFRDMADSAVSSWIPARTKIALENAYPVSFSWVGLPAEEKIFDRLLPLPVETEQGGTQEIQNHRRLAEALFPGAPECRTAFPHLTIGDADRADLSKLLRAQFSFDAERPFLLICPGTSSPMKEYPTKPLADALKEVVAAHALPIVIAGGPADTRTTKPLAAELGGPAKVCDVSGALDLARHATLIAMASAVLSMDSCHAHIAGATGTPAVVVFGRGQFGVFGPWGESPTFCWLTTSRTGTDRAFIYEHPLTTGDVAPEKIARALIEVLRTP